MMIIGSTLFLKIMERLEHFFLIPADGNMEPSIPVGADLSHFLAMPPAGTEEQKKFPNLFALLNIDDKPGSEMMRLRDIGNAPAEQHVGQTAQTCGIGTPSQRCNSRNCQQEQATGETMCFSRFRGRTGRGSLVVGSPCIGGKQVVENPQKPAKCTDCFKPTDNGLVGSMADVEVLHVGKSGDGNDNCEGCSGDAGLNQCRDNNGDGRLALQTALVTLLHIQKYGSADIPRKPVIPKRNLMCLSTLRTGACPYRESCNFAHNLVELQKKLELRKTSLCKYWLKGKCENDDCNFAHGEHELHSTTGVFKTTICKYWKQGCCYSGDLCRHAHGESDLRQENLPPHLEKKKQLQPIRHQTRGSSGNSRRGGRPRLYSGLETITTRNIPSSQQFSAERTLCRLPHSLLDTDLLVDKHSPTMIPIENYMWDTVGGSNGRRATFMSQASDMSTDALVSSASESPRNFPAHGTAGFSTISLWNVPSDSNILKFGKSCVANRGPGSPSTTASLDMASGEQELPDKLYKSGVPSDGGFSANCGRIVGESGISLSLCHSSPDLEHSVHAYIGRYTM